LQAARAYRCKTGANRLCRRSRSAQFARFRPWQRRGAVPRQQRARVQRVTGARAAQEHIEMIVSESDSDARRAARQIGMVDVGTFRRGVESHGTMRANSSEAVRAEECPCVHPESTLNGTRRVQRVRTPRNEQNQDLAGERAASVYVMSSAVEMRHCSQVKRDDHILPPIMTARGRQARRACLRHADEAKNPRLRVQDRASCACYVRWREEHMRGG